MRHRQELKTSRCGAKTGEKLKEYVGERMLARLTCLGPLYSSDCGGAFFLNKSYQTVCGRQKQPQTQGKVQTKTPSTVTFCLSVTTPAQIHVLMAGRGSESLIARTTYSSFSVTPVSCSSCLPSCKLGAFSFVMLESMESMSAAHSAAPTDKG